VREDSHAARRLLQAATIIGEARLVRRNWGCYSCRAWRCIRWAPLRKRSIQSFFPSACMPFRAREERLDRPPV